MLELGELIYGLLNADAALTAVVEDKIFPLMAAQDIQAPFITYTIGEEGGVSKEKGNYYTLSIDCYHETHDAAVVLSQQVKKVIQEQYQGFGKYLGSQPEYIAEKLITVNMNYKLKF